ncbi:MAG: DUF2798 domain-containing protein [Bosea sp. (in: a-proteobacteria)]
MPATFAPGPALRKEPAWRQASRQQEQGIMEGKARFIFPVLMAGVMALLMTALVTFLNLGLPSNFLSLWMRAFVIAWPCAAMAAFIAIPLARRATAAIIRVIGP